MILVASDLSPNAEVALRYALESRLNDEPITVFHALTRYNEEVWEVVADNSQEVIHRWLDEANRRLRDWVESVAGDGVESVVEMGPVSELVGKLAQKFDVTRVICGRTGRSNLVNRMVGSTAMRLAADVRVPVTVVPPEFRKIERRYLVPVDFSERSKDAVQFAANLAEEGDGSVFLMHVLPDFRLYLENILADSLLKARELRREKLYAFIDVARATTPNCTGLVLVGNPAERILSAAHDSDRHIVIPSTNKVGRVFLGSVAEKTIRDARVPVTII